MTINSSQDDPDANQKTRWLNVLPQPLREYAVVARECLRDWQTDLGLVLNAFALFAFCVGLFKLGLSDVFSKILQFYRGITTTFFWPLEQLFSIQIPGYVQDFILFWTLSGWIAARVLLRLHPGLHRFINDLLIKANDPETRSRLESTMGKAAFEEQIQWASRKKDFSEITLSRKIMLYIGCLITGPLYFLKIWKEAPQVPGQKVNGRTLIIILVVTLLLIVVFLFALSWVTL
ncbi:hypothetical protein Pan241w_28490 [Gimesia alba]|uniref:Uncharacterized protein n=1 Tax=Gimesia alba TaxID=2527973 RepID=A0A517RFX1_9PLAN|nr:hypothetical protein [Gimesia alba]QDT42760.1 hypothetical protein Pan241w_28490 [Gimesia alba]